MKMPLTMPLILRELRKDYNLNNFNEFFRNIVAFATLTQNRLLAAVQGKSNTYSLQLL